MTERIIIKPTKINAGAVAAGGTNAKIGLRNRAERNKRPVTSEARPVLAPAAIPEALSTKLVTVEVPRQAPAIVPVASARSARFALTIVPFSSFKFACSATPTKVPIVSNKSVNKNVKNTMKNLIERTLAHSNLQKYGVAGLEKGENPSGIEVTPKGIPIIVVITRPKRIAPDTFFIDKTIVMIRPCIATIAEACPKSKLTNAYFLYKIHEKERNTVLSGIL